MDDASGSRPPGPSQDGLERPSESPPGTRSAPARVPSEGASRGTLPEILRDLPGARVATDGAFGAAARVNFRGVESVPPVFLYAGVPLSGAFSGEENVELLPALGLASARSHPHVAPWTSARRGFSGTVDLVPCAFDSCLAGPSDARDSGARATAAAGSYLYRSAGAVAGSRFAVPGAGAGEVVVAAQHARARDDFPYTDEGNTLTRTDDDVRARRTGNDFERTGASVRASVAGVPLVGELTLLVAGGREGRGLPGPAGSDASRGEGAGGPERLARDLALASLEGRRVRGSDGVEIRAGAFHSAGRARRRGGSEEGIVFSTRELSFSSTGAHASLRVPIPLATGGDFGLGLRLTKETAEGGSPRGLEGRARLDARREVHAVSLARDATWNVGRATRMAASLDATVETARVDSKVDCTFAYGSGACGERIRRDEEALPTVLVTWRAEHPAQGLFPRLGVHLEGFRAARRPTLLERYGNASGVVSNLALGAERSVGAEVGAHAGPVSGACYLARDGNLIIQVRINPRTGRYVNVREARRAGCLAEAGLAPWGLLDVRARYTWSRAEGVDDAGRFPLPRSPRHQARERVTLTLPPVRVVGVRFVAAAYHEVNWESSSYLDSRARVRLTPHPLQNAGASVRFLAPGDSTLSEIGVAFTALNLTDARTARQGSSATGGARSVEHAGYVGYPLPGRRYVASLEAAF